jgi:hypothetical protein
MVRKLLVAAVCAAAVVPLSAGSAFAGEVTGNGKPTQAPAHANSICAFSGQNDAPNEPGEGGRVQSYGQIVRAGFKAEAPSPGFACNGHSGFLAGGG